MIFLESSYGCTARPNVIVAVVGRAWCNVKIQYSQESLSALTESRL